MTGNLDISQQILSDIIVFMKYARYVPEKQRRETWDEIVDRNIDMHIKKFPDIADEIKSIYEEFVRPKKVLPSMRALEDSIPIRTVNGWKNAGSIIFGDILFDSNGKKTKVLNVNKFINKPLYKIIFSDKSELIACDEHLWIIKTNDDIKYKKKERVVSTNFIRNHLKQGKRNNITIYNSKPIVLEEKKLKINPYIFGLWLGDGYSNGTQYSCSIEDSKFIMEYFIKNGYCVKKSNSTNIWTWNISGLKKDLKYFNLIKNKHIPKIYLNSSIKQRIELLQGLMDSDGCITKTGRCMFSNTNKNIVEGVKELLSSLGIKYTILKSKKKKRDHKQLYDIRFTTNLDISKLPRKRKNIRKNLLKQTENRKVVDVIYYGKGNASCFHVDSYNHSFLAGKQMIVTHNSLQFAGKAIKVNNSRIYNCAYLPIDHYRAFSEVMFLLLGGSGVGISVQKSHIKKLPEIRKPLKRKKYVIEDSIMGWAEAVRYLIQSYLPANGYNKPLPNFDFSEIRAKDTPLVTAGGKAPGPEPLKDCLHNLKRILDRKIDGDKLSSLECHDMCCFISDAVLAGGIRRSSMISFFDINDADMLTCKYNHWYEKEPQRGRANNSAVILRHKVKEEDFFNLWEKIKFSNAGEPGIFFSNDRHVLSNPSLRKGTLVLTDNGIYPINELENKEFKVKNLNGIWSPAKCFLSGKNKELNKITLENDIEYYSTNEHKWAVLKKEGRYYNLYKEETKNLKKGMFFPVLKNTEIFNGKIGDYDDGFLIGWLYGDGWVTDRKDNGVRQYGMVVSKKDGKYGILNKLKKLLKKKISIEPKFTYRENGTYETNFQAKRARKYFDKFGVDKKENGLPNVFFTEMCDNFIKGFIDGLFSSDGCVYNHKHTNINLISSREKLLDDVRNLLGFYGIISRKYKKIIKPNGMVFPNGKVYNKEYTCFILSIANKRNVQWFFSIFSLTHIEKDKKLRKEKFCFFKKPDMIRIKNIEKTDIKENVWDIQVNDNTHCFQLSNCITGNCNEISLKPNGFCNLTEINASTLESQEDFNSRVKAAAFIGTLQASYTDFHYLRDEWKETAEKEALLGVGMTGIASGHVLDLDIKEAATFLLSENERVAKLIKINKAARIGCVKPSGTSSIVLGCSSGIHAWHSEYYIRRLRVGKDEVIYKYLKRNLPDLVEDDYFRPHLQAIISIPQKAPIGAITRNESPLDLLERVKRIRKDWIEVSHRKGSNFNNVSCTVSIKENEWDEVGKWMWKNQKSYNGLSVIPYDLGTHVQPPFEEITKKKYLELFNNLKEIDLSKIKEKDDFTNLQGEAACAGNSCEV